MDAGEAIVALGVAGIGMLGPIIVGLIGLRRLGNVETKVDGRLTELLDTTRQLAASQVSEAGMVGHAAGVADTKAAQKGDKMALDLEIGTATLFMEASAEPLLGKQAVAAVLANRLHDGRWGPTLAAVCLAPEQFSCWNASDPNRGRMARTPDDDAILVECRGIIETVLSGRYPDPTGGAMWYYAADIRPPSWVAGAVFAGQFGSQLFYRGVK